VALVDDRGLSEPAFERQPPQDLAAEQSVLGGMMLSKDAIADVVEVLSSNDFYRPAHQSVYNCVLDLYGRGEPADPITVSAELERRGELARVGGAPYLHTLIATVPTAANAGYYAEIVAEKAVLRRLVEAGTRIVQLGYSGADGSDVAEVVDRAQASIYDVVERRASEDYVVLEELLQPTMDEIDAIASRGGQALGVPTGFADLDAVTNGLHPGQMIIVAARPGVGKALALDTPLPTPTGWTTMADVRIGDELIDAEGKPTRVVAATEVMHGRPCYKVEFSDGTVLVADARHQWLTETWSPRRPMPSDSSDEDWYTKQRVPAVHTTEEIAATVRCADGAQTYRHRIRAAKPLVLPERDLPLPPYVLGVWLADSRRGPSWLTVADAEVIEHVRAEGITAAKLRKNVYQLELHDDGGIGFTDRLRALGVLDDRHIPLGYLRSSQAQRRALLAGLLDRGGSVESRGGIRFTSSSLRLVEDLRELCLGLGYLCRVRRRLQTTASRSYVSYMIAITTRDAVFRLTRKRGQVERNSRFKGRSRTGTRIIVGVCAVDSVPVRCVEVDNAEHLYLAGRAMIPTHNSTLGLDFARSCSVKHGMASAIFSLEMSKTEIVMRLLSAEARIRLADMRGGRMSDDDWTRLARRMSEISEAPLFVDDSPNLTLMEIRAKARRLKQRNDLKLVIVDYLQLMTSGKRVESRQQEVSEFSRHLKLLAKELDVPVIAISQLNRGPEQRNDKRPMLSDLRESGSLEQDADAVILIHRPDAWEKDDPRAGEADLILAKHRAGPTSTVTVAHQLHYSRFTDLAHG